MRPEVKTERCKEVSSGGKIFVGRYRSPLLGDIFAVSSAVALREVRIGGVPDVFFEEVCAAYGYNGREDVCDGGPVLDRLFSLFDLYFSGTPVEFDVEVEPRGTEFEKRVWSVLRTIPFGSVRSYGWVARMAGSPAGARAVGMACARNRLPLVIPCHRVVAASGGLGGFSLGLDVKRALLGIEGVSTLDRRPSGQI